MSGSCNQTITEGSTNSTETKISANGQVRVYVKRKPYFPAGYVPSTVSVLNPSQLTTLVVKGVETSVAASFDPNVLIETDQDGLAVLAGKTNSVLLFKDAVSGELKADVIAAPAPNKLNPCDSDQPNRNAFRVTPEGCVVLTQAVPSGIDVTQCNGAYTYVDCASGELRVHIQIAPEVLGAACSPIVDVNGKLIKKNGLICTPAGLSVLSGKSESVETYLDCESGEFRARLLVKKDLACDTADRKGVNALVVTAEGAQVLTGKNVKGGVNTYRDCDTDALLAEVVLKPAPDKSTCEFNPNPNALRLFDDGLAVLTGKNVAGGVETFVDCVTQELHAKLVLKPDPVAAKCDPSVLTNALRLTVDGLAVEVADSSCIALNIDCTSGILSAVPKFGAASSGVFVCADDGVVLKVSAQACNGLQILGDGLYAPGKNSYTILGANVVGGKQVTSSYSSPSVGWSFTNSTCKVMAGPLHIKAPSGVVLGFTDGEVYISYEGSYSSSLGQNFAFAEQYFTCGGGVQDSYGFTGASSYRPVQINPGETFVVTVKYTVRLVSPAATTNVNLNDMYIDAMLFNVDGRV